MLKKFASSQIDKRLVRINGIEISVTIADTPQTRTKGLMYKSHLPVNEGCLLKFDNNEHIKLWMKGCKIPLQVAFINDDGRIIDIQHMDMDNGYKIYSSPTPCRFALEMNAGFFNNNKIKIQDKIEGLG